MPPRANKIDPLRKFNFRIYIDGNAVAGLTKCSGLTFSVDSQDYRTGDMDSFVQKLPGQTSFEAITLEQGVTMDKTFQDWASVMTNYVGNKGSDAEKTPDDFRKDIDIAVHDLKGAEVKRYRVYNCWVSKYTAIPDLDASANDVMIQTLELQNEGIQAL